MKFNINILFGVLFSLVVFLIFDIAIFSNNSSLSSTATILAMIFGGLGLSILVKNKNTVEQNVSKEQKEGLIQEIAHDVIFSLQSIDVKLEKALYGVHKLSKSEGVYVGIFEDNQVHVLKQKYSSSEYSINSYIKRKDHVFPIEEAILNSLGNQDNIREIEISGKAHKAYCFPLITKHSLDSFGVFMVLFAKNHKVTPQMVDKMKFMAESISFAVNIVYKKDAIMQTNMGYYKKFNEIDESLHIYNENKVQKTIKQEFDRYKRYLTPLSIIIFEIDDIKNLSNVLPKEDMLTLKQEFVGLVKFNIRQTDIFGVWKDDVFAIVAQNVDYQGAKTVVDKLQTIMKKKKFHRVNQLTCSYGITGFSQKDTPELCQERAYDALIKAQNKGGDRAEIQLLV